MVDGCCLQSYRLSQSDKSDIDYHLNPNHVCGVSV